MAKVELGISRDITISEFLEMCDQYNLEFNIIESEGSEEGGPLVEFTGDDEDVNRFLTESEYEEDF